MPTAVSGTSYSPTTSTLASLQRCVVDYVQGGDDDELLAVATRAINMAIDKCNAVMWKRLVSSQDITLSASTSTYALTSDFKEAHHCELLDSNGNPKDRIHFKDYKTLSEDFPDSTVMTDPWFYTVDHLNRTFTLATAPSANYVSSYPTARLWYHKRLARLTQASDTHGGVPEFDRFLCWDARADVAAIRGNPAMMDRAERAAAQIWKMLRVDDVALVMDWPDIGFH